MMTNAPSSSGGGVELMSPAQKWIGGGLISLVLLGLLVAFVASPMTAPDRPSSVAPTGAVVTTTTLNADTGADTSLAANAFVAQTDVPPAPAAHPKGSTGISPRLAVMRPVLQKAIPNNQFSGATPVSAVETDSKEALKAEHSLSDANNGEVVRMKVGERVVIRLKENCTTGYGWQLENPEDATKQGLEAVPKHLELEHDKSRKGFAKNAAGRQLMGVPGVHEWVFRATSAGQSQVCASYRRPWQSVKTTSPAQQYCVKLDVRD